MTNPCHDEFVTCWSQEDHCFIAAGARTGQIGTGDSAEEALADGILAVKQVMALAEEDKTIDPFPGEWEAMGDDEKLLALGITPEHIAESDEDYAAGRFRTYSSVAELRGEIEAEKRKTR